MMTPQYRVQPESTKRQTIPVGCL